jgi:hypothetical protein
VKEINSISGPNSSKNNNFTTEYNHIRKYCNSANMFVEPSSFRPVFRVEITEENMIKLNEIIAENKKTSKEPSLKKERVIKLINEIRKTIYD